MKVTGVAWQGFALPFRRPYVTSDTWSDTRYGLLLFLHADSGIVAVGEASPLGTGNRKEVVKTAALISRLAPILLTMNPDDPDLSQRLSELLIPAVLRFGIETALLDLRGKARGCSVAELLGGVPGSIPVNALITAEEPEYAVAMTKEALALGFTSLKLKVALGTIEQDEALVWSVRRVTGPALRLRIDANQGWSTAQAIEAIRRLAAYELEYVEQPVKAEDIEGLGEVRRCVSVPVAADEALGSVEDLHRLLAADAADLFIIKAGRLGGLRTAMEVMRRAREAKKPLVITSSLESGVGLVASAHLAATLSSHPFAHGLATTSLLERDLLSAPFVPSQGALAIPKGPGLGVAVDLESLDRYSIGIKGWTGSWKGASLPLA